MDKTKKMVLAALMAAFTCVATMVIKFPTPTLGYIHLGDALVLLCGITLGPVTGALAAGIGSGFADIFSGYAIWAPGTILVKGICAILASFFYRRIRRTDGTIKNKLIGVGTGGIVAELWMVAGYFLYEILIVCVSSDFKTSLATAALSSASGVPFNLLQGLAGMVIAILILPALMKIDDIRTMVNQ